MNTNVITTRDQLPERDYTLAAWFDYDMDLLAVYLGATPTEEAFADGMPFPHRYRCIYVSLSSDRYASLTQTEMHPERVEIDLELHAHRLFDEADLVEIVSMLPSDIGPVSKIDNGFTWVPVGTDRR